MWNDFNDGVLIFTLNPVLENNFLSTWLMLRSNVSPAGVFLLVFIIIHMETLFYYHYVFRGEKKETASVLSLLKYPHPSQEQLIERSDTLLCCFVGGFFFFFSFFVPRFLFSFYECLRRPLAPSYEMSFCCLSDPTGRISPGPFIIMAVVNHPHDNAGSYSNEDEEK